MSTEIPPKTVSEILRAAADLIVEKGFRVMKDDTIAGQLGLFGIDLSTAVLWAAHGGQCRARELSSAESVRAAEVLDRLERELRMAIDIYERKNVEALPQHISHDLRLAAWNLERAS